VATATEIFTAVDAIAGIYKPLKILLFDSYAYGTPNADSDVDFLVLKNFSGSPHDQFVKIRTTINFPFPVYVLVRRPGVVRQQIKMNDFFLREITSKGIALYEAGNTRMGDQGRRRLRRHLASVQIPQTQPIRYDMLSLSAMR